MRARGETGSIVRLLCDRGERHADTLYDTAWLAARGIAVPASLSALRSLAQCP